MSVATFPPTGPVTTKGIIPSYLYSQYADDDDLQAFVATFNAMAQARLDWFNEINLPIYTSPTIADGLLDWVAEGLYGITRPALPFGTLQGLGLLDSFMLNQIVIASYTVEGAIVEYITTDDAFKRIITWHFFKRDGWQFSVSWLKRRVTRFLVGLAGAAPNIGGTYPIGVTFGEDNDVIITITLTIANGITLTIAELFQAAVASGAVELPFQYNFSVTIVNDLGPTNLVNNSGILTLVVTTGWPTSASGLLPGALWSNANVVTVVPGATPNPFAAPIFFGLITSADLLILGGDNLPLSNPGVGTGQIWNNSNVATVA